MKDIPGFEGFYKATENGEIYSVISGKFLKQNLKPTGYLTIEFNVDGVKSDHRVHRLIALTFIENSDNKPYVNHKDGDKSNNFIDNLEWSTMSENTIHAVENGLNSFYYNIYEVFDPYGNRFTCYGSYELMERVGISKNTVTKYCDSGECTKTGFVFYKKDQILQNKR